MLPYEVILYEPTPPYTMHSFEGMIPCDAVNLAAGLGLGDKISVAAAAEFEGSRNPDVGSPAVRVYRDLGTEVGSQRTSVCSWLVSACAVSLSGEWCGRVWLMAVTPLSSGDRPELCEAVSSKSAGATIFGYGGVRTCFQSNATSDMMCQVL
jgi:hypothetical protein